MQMSWLCGGHVLVGAAKAAIGVKAYRGFRRSY
jgi:hypothetical protein